MSFSPYKSYQDSGSRWLGNVPSSWTVKAVKHCFSVVGGSTPKSEVEEFWDGEHVWVTPADLGGLTVLEITDSARRITTAGLESCGTNLVPPGSIVLSTRAPIGSLAIAGVSVCTNQGCKSLIPKDGASPRYFAYVLSVAGEELNLRGRGTTFLELSADALGAFEIAVPPATEQAAIAAFLDRETAKIDALVEDQRRLVEFLKEKRQAVISHAVTKGLDPTLPMKPSGVEWLGEVPAHWGVSRMRYVSRPGTSITYGIVQAGPHIEDGIPYIKTSDMSGPALPLDGYSKTSVEIDASYSRSKVEAGDLVIAIRASVGKCLPVPAQLDGANLTQGTAKIAPGDIVDAGFLLAYINAQPVQTYLNSVSKGATFKEITLDTLRKTPVLLPPLAEQRTIKSHVQELTERFQVLIDSAEAAEALLIERRLALISAAVTGKIDVRGLVPQPEAVAA
jgi:type I restriction enzyme S subunit